MHPKDRLGRCLSELMWGSGRRLTSMASDRCCSGRKVVHVARSSGSERHGRGVALQYIRFSERVAAQPVPLVPGEGRQIQPEHHGVDERQDRARVGLCVRQSQEVSGCQRKATLPSFPWAIAVVERLSSVT